MLKILQARFKQYVKCEPPNIQASYRKGRRTRDQFANICWIVEKTTEFQKTSTSALLIMPKPLCGSQQTWTILQEIGIPDHLTCLLRNLYVGQEATIRTSHGTTNWFPIEKGVHQGCILALCLCNSYAEYIMQNARMDKVQAGNKISRRNINYLRYTDVTSLMT